MDIEQEIIHNFDDNKISFKNLIFAPYLEAYSIIMAPN